MQIYMSYVIKSNSIKNPNFNKLSSKKADSNELRHDDKC